MKVYLVMRDLINAGGSFVVKAFSSREAAEGWCDSLEGFHRDGEKWVDLDPYPAFEFRIKVMEVDL